MFSQVRDSSLIGKGVQVGTGLVGQSLDALEMVGSTAMNAVTSMATLTQDTILGSESNEEPTIDGPQGTEKGSKDEHQFSVYFEELNGPVHLQALENLSIESMMKTQQHYRKLTFEQREIVDDQTAKIQDIFKEEYEPEAQVDPTKILLNLDDKVSKQWNLTLEFSQSVKEKISKTEWKNEMEPLKNSENLFLEQATKNITHIEVDCKQSLARLSSLYVEQLLRIAEWCLLMAEGKLMKVSHFDSYCTDFCKLSDYFDQELTSLSTQYIDTIQTISKYVQVTLNVNALNRNQNVQNLPNVSKQFTTTSKTACNNIYMDVGNAISNVQDAKKLLLNVCKFVVIVSEGVGEVVMAVNSNGGAVTEPVVEMVPKKTPEGTVETKNHF